MSVSRREVLKYGAATFAVLAVNRVTVPGVFESAEAFAAVRALDLTFTDALKEMAVSTAAAPVTCNYWCFKDAALALPSVPGPVIFAKPDDTIRLRLHNALGQPHSFVIPGVFKSGPILPGASRTFAFKAPRPGTYLYFDAMNAPVNRVMGLHGALIVMPRRAAGTPTNRVTPYDRQATPAVRRLFNDLGGSGTFPGLPWEAGDPANHTDPFRQWIWLLHEADADLFRQVAALPTGAVFPALEFRQQFQPKFFTITGESGFFVHDDHAITPHQRVGEPGVVRILNAGLWTHSLHIHANHVFQIAVNNLPLNNLLFGDTFGVRPLERMDWLLPFERPPDVPHAGGAPLLTARGGPTWPPLEELDLSFDVSGFPVRQSPLHYPMHDHTEPTQTANGGNYPMGMIAGVVFTGDRTLPGGVVDFPM